MFTELDAPRSTGPKDTIVPLGTSWPGEVLIDSVAGPLSTLPDVLLTSTVKVVPSSVVTVLGVVYVDEFALAIAFPFFIH